MGKSQRLSIQATSEKTSIERLELDKLQPFCANEEFELAHAAGNLTGRLAHWMGDWANVGNWREDHSRSLTNDYFGVTELRASIRALYQGLAAAALDALNEHGLDISEYRDKEGKWQIHADKIDSIVIGERIVMNTDGSAKSKDAETNSDSSPKKAA